MNIYIYNMLCFIIVFIFTFLLQFNFFIKPTRKQREKEKLKGKKEKVIMEIEYLSSRFKIDKKDLLNSSVGTQICMINAFIMSSTATVVMMVPVIDVVRLLIAFALLIILIYISYELYGKKLENKFKEEK